MKNQARTIRNLCIFILVVLSCGWVGVWVDALTGETIGDFSDASNGTSGMGIFIVAPLLTWLLLRAFIAATYQEKPALVWGSNPYLPCSDCSYAAYRGAFWLAKSPNPLDGLSCGLWYFRVSRNYKEFL